MKPDYIDRLIPDSRDIVLLSQSAAVPVMDILFRAIDAKIDLLRDEIERHPKFSGDALEDDLVFILGAINGLNWVKRLPARSDEMIRKIG